MHEEVRNSRSSAALDSLIVMNVPCAHDDFRAQPGQGCLDWSVPSLMQHDLKNIGPRGYYLVVKSRQARTYRAALPGATLM